MDNKKTEKKRTRHTGGKVYYKAIACQATILECEKITNYCLKNNISKSRFMAAAAMYCIDNNIDVEKIYNSDSGENYD